MTTKIDRYIADHGRLPADLLAAVRRIAQAAAIPLLPSVDVHLRARHMTALESRLSGQGAATPAYVLFTALNVLPGVLGFSTARWGDWRFWQPKGCAQLMHEVWHVHQCLRDGLVAMLRAYAGGMVRSIPDVKLWSHPRIPMEREAIEVQARFARQAKRHTTELAALGDLWL